MYVKNYIANDSLQMFTKAGPFKLINDHLNCHWLSPHILVTVLTVIIIILVVAIIIILIIIILITVSITYNASWGKFAQGQNMIGKNYR